MLRVEHAACGWIPASPRGATIAGGLIRAPRSFRLSARPAASTLMAALTSRSWVDPQGQVHDRTLSAILSLIQPQSEHIRVDGKNRSTRANVRPYRAALYSTMATNCDQPASCTDLASRVRPRPATHRSSTYTAWLSRMIAVDSLCCQSRRVSATRACARATLTTAFLRLFEPLALRATACCSRRSLRAAWRRNFGAATFVPSDSTAKWVSPRSMPTCASTSGNGAGAACTTNEAKYRPAASRITVTDDGAAGRVRDQRTSRSPIFGNRSRPLSQTLNRALAVNRIACRLSLRDRNRGGATVRPLRLPVIEAKKLRYATFRSARACCNTTADTPQSHARSGVSLACVMTRLDNSPSDTYFSPASRACRRRRSPSLNTTRAHPNARASACCWDGVG